MRNFGFLIFIWLLVACVPRHAVMMNGNGIAIGAPLSTVADGPFRLLFGGPKGDVSSTSDVTLAFSRSVPTSEVPATVVREDDGRAVPGSWQWFGESAAVFHPDKGFARETSYRVEVRRITAIDGSKLDDSAAPFGFTTERPKLRYASYEYEEKKGAHLVNLTFDEPVTVRSAIEAIRIEAGTTNIPFRVLDESQARTMTLQADPMIARLENVAVVASTALRGTEGPLGPLAAERKQLDGVGPFKVRFTCGNSETSAKCDRWGSFQLDLTREVNERDLLRHLVVEAPAKPNPDEIKAINERNPYRTTSFDLSNLISPDAGKKYRVTLKAGLVSNDKQKLDTDQIFEFETKDLDPNLEWRDIDAQVAVVESARKFIPIAISATNVPNFDVVSAPLAERDLPQFFASPKVPPNAVTAKLVNDARANESKLLTANVAEGRPAGASGLWVVATHAKGLEDRVRLLSVTDLGINSKWSPHGALVWVTRLSTAEPVAGATVSLRRLSSTAAVEAFSTTTDAEGIAKIPGDVATTFLHEQTEHDAPTPILYVKKEADWTFTRLPELDVSLMTAIGEVFVERGLYRPGESVFAKGYFRMPSPSGLASLAGKTVYLEALDGRDRVFGAQTATLDAFGGFSAEIPIPKNIWLGRGIVRARIGAKSPTLQSGKWARWSVDRYWPARDFFTIDSFRTPEFKVEAKTDRQTMIRGETVSLTTTGTYLLGAPMTNVPVQVDVSRSRTSFVPRGLEAFGFGDDDFDAKEPAISQSRLDGKLDSTGHAIFTYPIPSAKTLARPWTYSFAADIGDVSRAFSMGDTASVLVHPSDTYLGIKANLGAPPLVPGKSIHVELVAGGIDGTRRGGVAAKIELFRASEKGEPVTTHRTCAVTTDAAKVASCDLSVANEGKHWIRATAVDASGRALAASASFIVLPKNTKPPPPSPPATPSKPAEPRLTFEQECKRELPTWSQGLTVETHYAPYYVGENAHVCLRTYAKSARGLFTLEREGILRRQPVFEFSSAQSKLLDVPMTEDLYPDANVVLSSEIGRTSAFPPPGGTDSGAPLSNGGSQRLAVKVAAKKLTVTIETEKEARPGAEIELRLNVKDGDNHGVAAQVTLWAIDEGIHILMPKLVPTPETIFGEDRFSDVVETDTRKNIFYEHGGLHQAKSPSLRQGSTSVNERSLVGRSVFKPTAFFLDTITRANGAASVRAKLPDNLTTWKVFAVAATAKDAFGSGQTSFTTNKPLMLRPQLPRFLRVGDRFEGTVMVDSIVKSPLEVAFSTNASGVVAATGASRVTIPAEGHVRIHVPIEAKAIGTGKLVFEARSAGYQDSVTIDEEVGTTASLESVVVAGDIPISKSPITINEPLGDLSKVRPDIGSFDYRISTTPLVGLAASLNELVEYPYGCTEQLTSRLVPLIRLRGMAKDFGVELPSNIDASVRSSLAALVGHQRSDGGFGFWRESKKSEAWLTVLALDALQGAEAHGYVVPASSMESAQKFLESSSDLDPAAAAMREDVLASSGKPRLEALRKLADNPKLPIFARALTAHALATADRDLAKSLLNPILAGAQSNAAVTTFADEPSLVLRSHLSSNSRTTALVLRALLAVDPQNPLVRRTVRGLLSLRHEGRWQTTQDTAWALTALDDARTLFRPPPGQTTAEFLFDRHVDAKTRFDGNPAGETRSGSIAMSRLLGAPGAAVAFESDGARPLYFEGALRYARSDPPMSPLDHGFTVARSLRPLRPGAELRVGDYAVADLVVVTGAPRDLVVLDDPIPAGFEAVNQTFASMDRGAPLVTDPAISTLTHRELHDDRVTSFFDALPAGVTHTRYVLRTIAAGHFAHPPARAECMYMPDIFGRTATSWVDTR
jgi:uncharacterized protein YfaS (alpha-2-macroglobulin family)